MELKQLYREIVNEHNLHPEHKHELEGATFTLRGVNPTCGDDITLRFKLDGDTIAEGAFTGTGCAISQASADMMIDACLGKTRAEAIALAENFMGMIRGEERTEEDIEALEEAAALQDIAHMPARVKCAMLGWRTMKELLEGSTTDATTE